MRRLILTLVVVGVICGAAPIARADAGTDSLNIVPLGPVIADFYKTSLSLVGLCVFCMFLLAGLGYMIPALQSKVGKPMDIFMDAVIGTVILFGAFVILNTINPDLVKFPTSTAAPSK